MKVPKTALYIGWTGLFVLGLVSCTLIGYIYNITFGSLWIIPITVYGLFMLLHLSMQFLFGAQNLALVAKTRNAFFEHPDSWYPLIGVQVVGHQEAEHLFRKCLLSLKKLTYPRQGKLIVVSDGNTTDDRYMATVFRQTFPKGVIITTDWVLAEQPVEEQAQYIRQLTVGANEVCILQPQRGKREALYSAFQIHIANGAELVFTTDSDTRVQAESLTEMALLFEKKEVGAATGNVEILNVENWLSFLSSLRYWFAFNLERSAQSFFGVVSCVSGPLGMYRSTSLQQILVPWVQQLFLGQKCTYGDDRHLTNLVLSLGEKVVYTPYASCKTETPTIWGRWILQQTRWSKSFYRELLYNARWFHKHPLWLTYDLVYQSIYPFFLLFSIGLQLSFYFRFQTTLFFWIWIATIVGGGLLRSAYAYGVTGSFKYVFFALYSFLYIGGLLPSKLIAVSTLWDVNWGTSPRKNLAFQYSFGQFLLANILYWGILFQRILEGVFVPRLSYEYVYEKRESEEKK